MGRMPFVLLLALAVGLTACTNSTMPMPARDAPLAVTPLADGMRLAAGGRPLTTLGYLYRDTDGLRLVDGLSFSQGSAPMPLAPAAAQLWLDDQSIAPAQQAGQAAYGAVLARGRLDGPGRYGPGGRYGYRLADAQLQPVTPSETTIRALLDGLDPLRQRFVRLQGGLIVLPDSALLVERLEPGGAPATNARQIKLAAPLRDNALLRRLHATPTGAVRYGPVQIEGLWSGRLLAPLAIRPTT